MKKSILKLLLCFSLLAVLSLSSCKNERDGGNESTSARWNLFPLLCNKVEGDPVAVIYELRLPRYHFEIPSSGGEYTFSVKNGYMNLRSKHLVITENEYNEFDAFDTSNEYCTISTSRDGKLLKNNAYGDVITFKISPNTSGKPRCFIFRWDEFDGFFLFSDNFEFIQPSE